jgi:hypothetical protein
MRGTERVHQEFPLRIELLLIVTRTGRDYRPGSRKRIEQVARKGSPSIRAEVASPGNAGTLEERLVPCPRVAKESIPSDQFDGSPESVPRLINPTSAICRSLPTERPIVELAHNVG